MFNRYLTYYPAAMQFIIFCGVTSMCLLTGQFVSALLFEKISGISIVALFDMEEISPELVFQFKIVQVFSQVLSLLLPAYLFAYFAYPKPAVYLGISKKVKIHYILLTVLLFVIAIPFSSMLEELSRTIPFLNPEGKDRTEVLVKAMLQGRTFSDLLLNTLVICLIPAITEELFFRGSLQQVLLNWIKSYPFTAMIIVAVSFSAFHGELNGFLSRIYLGMILCLLYYFTGNIWYSILFHFLNNFIIIFVAFLHERGLTGFDLNEKIHIPYLIGLLSLLLTSSLMFYFYQKRVLFAPVEVEKDDNE